MAIEFVSLAIIAAIAAVTPIVARLIPHQLVPETVLLIVLGALLGPHVLGFVIVDDDAIEMLSDLGCAFLFLLAGYEIEPKSILGVDGKHGFATWAISLGIAAVFVGFMPTLATGPHSLAATSLLLTTTALGTLLPILKERGLLGTRLGNLIVSYGTWGELAPVLAMAMLLSSRSMGQTAVILLALVALCVFIALAGSRIRERSSELYRFLTERANTTSQTLIRLVVLMLVVLVAFSALFDLDIVLGAFAAGFVMRFLAPTGAPNLELKLDGIAHGFFVPLFFVVSGCKIDLAAVAAAPLLLVSFIVALVLVRCVPIVVSLSLRTSTRKDLSMHNRLATAFYCTTALPLIVAITSLAVDGGIMEESVASVLVAAGALTVFLMPLLGSLTCKVADAKPIEAAREIAQNPHDIRSVVHEHLERERELTRRYRKEAKLRAKKGIDAIGNPDERRQASELAKRHLSQRRELAEAQRAEIEQLYRSYHEDKPPSEMQCQHIREQMASQEKRGKVAR